MRVILVLMICLLSLSARAEDDLETRQKALDIIKQTVDSICNIKIDTEGSTSEQKKDAEGKINAQLKGIASKFFDLGMSADANYAHNQTSYKNVSQADLLAAIKDSDNCRLKVFTTLQEKMLLPLNAHGDNPTDTVTQAPAAAPVPAPAVQAEQNNTYHPPAAAPAWPQYGADNSSAYGDSYGSTQTNNYNSYNQPNHNQQQIANICVTFQGAACEMNPGVVMTVGQSCICYNNNNPGIARKGQLNNYCSSSTGGCQLNVMKLVGSPCMCTSRFGWPSAGVVPPPY